MDKTLLLDRLRVEGDERLLLSRVLDRQRKAENGAAPAFTDFLSPREQILAQELLRLSHTPEDSYLFTGGVPGAERQILCFLPGWMSPDDFAPDASPIRALRAAWRDGETLSHRDLLGGLMGLGIVRGKIGDIYVSADSADALALDSVTEFLSQNWASAGRVKLRVSEIPLDAVRVPERKAQEIRDTVSSPRLDAVIASGFRMSRGKAAELVNAGRVQVNWLDCAKPDRILQPGDSVSARGFGRFTLSRIGEPTRKGRIPVFITRFL
jgi:RNA-binding protein YlmH